MGALNRNSEQTKERMDIVEALLAKLWRHREIEKQCAAKWDISRTQARKYIALVYEEWAERAAMLDPSKERHRLKAALQDLFVTACNGGDLRAAVDAADRLCRIDGLYSPQQVVVGATVTANIRMTQQMTTAEKRKEIEKLLDMRKKLLDGRQAGPATNGSNGHSNGSNGTH